MTRIYSPIIIQIFLIVILAAVSCRESDENGGSEQGSHTETSADSDTDSDTDTDADADTGSNTDADADGDSDADADSELDSDTDSDTDSDSDSDIEIPSSCDYDKRVGAFLIFLAEDYTSFNGSVLDGVLPASIPEEIRTEGMCALLGPKKLFCDPACTDLGETCSESGTCIDAPLKHTVGTVTVDGMSQPLSIEPNGITFDYSKTMEEPYPGFQEGADITLKAEGGDFEPFELKAKGVSIIETDDEAILVERDSPVELTWQPSDRDGSVYVHIKLIVDLHGTSTDGWIVCDVPDTGAFTIPSALVTDLMDLGLSGFPKVEISRRSLDTTDISLGCVELIVYSQISLPVQVPGLDSCNENDDCEEGEFCQEDLVCG